MCEGTGRFYPRGQHRCVRQWGNRSGRKCRTLRVVSNRGVDAGLEHTSCANEDINIFMLSIFCLNTRLGNPLDRCWDKIDLQGIESVLPTTMSFMILHCFHRGPQDTLVPGSSDDTRERNQGSLFFLISINRVSGNNVPTVVSDPRLLRQLLLHVFSESDMSSSLSFGPTKSGRVRSLSSPDNLQLVQRTKSELAYIEFAFKLPAEILVEKRVLEVFLVLFCKIV